MIEPLEPEQDEDLDDGTSEYQWCIRCERAYKQGEHRLMDGLMMCPYEDCDGDTVMDGWLWPSVRQDHPEYPEVPEMGKVYPLYSSPVIASDECQQDYDHTDDTETLDSYEGRDPFGNPIVNTFSRDGETWYEDENGDQYTEDMGPPNNWPDRGQSGSTLKIANKPALPGLWGDFSLIISSSGAVTACSREALNGKGAWSPALSRRPSQSTPSKACIHAVSMRETPASSNRKSPHKV